MDKMGYEIIMEGLYTLRTEIKRDIVTPMKFGSA